MSFKALSIIHNVLFVAEECKVSCLDSISADSKAIVTLSLAELPQNPGRFTLAMGGLDNKIKLYCGERTGKFTSVCELKGHTDWIRSLDFSLPLHSTDEPTNSIMLVSSSQDKVIRIWKLVLVGDVGSWQREITLASYIEGPVFDSGRFTYQVSVESVLIGHEDWVYSVEWQPPVTGHQALSILSASMDKVNLWKRRYKLCGHGNELFSLCCDHNGTLVASSCKVSSPRYVCTCSISSVQY